MYNKIKYNKSNVQKNKKVDKQIEQTLIDEIDKKILKKLLTDSRFSYRQIARELKLSVGTVLKRIKRLEKGGIIKYYTTILNHEKLGFDLIAITHITFSKGKLIETEKKIAKIKNVCAVYDVTGNTDAIIISKFKNRKELGEFTKTLLSMPYVERTNTNVVLTIIKEDFRILI